MMAQLSVWFVLAAALFAIIAGLMNILSVIALRHRLFDLEAMVMQKWSEAPWWTRRDSDLHTTLANQVLSLAGHRCCCRCSCSQSRTTTKALVAELEGETPRASNIGAD